MDNTHSKNPVLLDESYILIYAELMRKAIFLFLIIALVCTPVVFGFQLLAGFIVWGSWFGMNSILALSFLLFSTFSSFILFPLGAYTFYSSTKEDLSCPKTVKIIFTILLLLLAYITSPYAGVLGYLHDFFDQLPYKINAKVDQSNNCKIKNGLNNYSDADGWIREEYYCVNGIRQGPYKKFALHAAGYGGGVLQASALKAGDLLEEGTYKNGKQDGMVKQYGDLVVTSELTYKDGLLNGPFRTYYKNGQLHEEGTYKNALRRDETKSFDGVYRSYDEKGNLYIESVYKDGRSTSNYQQSAEEQNHIRELDYQSERCKNQNGENKVFFAVGPLMTKFICKNGRFNGLFEEYYLSGSIFSRLMYVDGNKEGQFLGFFENGKIEREGTYKNDKETGTFKYYNEDGSLKVEYKH